MTNLIMTEDDVEYVRNENLLRERRHREDIEALIASHEALRARVAKLEGVLRVFVFEDEDGMKAWTGEKT